jgi:hypothetical protein
MGVYSSSGKTANPLAGLGILCGILGAACSAVLWLYHFQPDSTLLGSYSEQVAHGGVLADQLRILAATLGVMAIIAAIAAGLGGRGGGTIVAALLLGIAALSYPVLTWLNVVTRFVPNPMRQ